MSKKYRFQRSNKTRQYKKIFYIFSEGKNPEKAYFEMLQNKSTKSYIDVAPHDKKTSALQVLDRAKKYIENNPIKNTDEVWLVVDVDSNSKSDLEILRKWSLQRDNYGLALSNPKFEYWLLLHFHKGNQLKNPKECESKLLAKLPTYNKDNVGSIEIGKLESNLNQAIENAKIKSRGIEDWFVDYHTTFYELVEKILERE